MMHNKKFLVFSNTVSLLVMLLANYGSFAFIFSSETVASVSYKYNTLFAPAGYAFAIWSLIFLLCIGFVIFQFILLRRNDPQNIIDKCGFWFTFSNLYNAMWIYFWTNEMIGVSVLLILLLLLCLTKLLLIVISNSSSNGLAYKLWVYWPVSIYFGWIIVATAACIAAWLVYLGWNGSPLSPNIWTILLIIVAALIYYVLLKKYNLVSSAMVGVWALCAIAVKHWNVNMEIAITSVTASVLIFIASMLMNPKKRIITQ